MEHRIRALCRALIDTDDVERARTLSKELQKAIHQHLVQLRTNLLRAMYPPPSSSSLDSSGSLS